MGRPAAGNVLLLSINEQHVQKILEGTKKFELRKRVPRDAFRRVYLLQTKGEGVVGWFDAGSVVRAPLKDLWDRVGPAATSRARFFRYFDGFTNGCAIPIGKTGTFAEPINSESFRRVYPRFSVPMSSVLLRAGHPLAEYLEAARRLQEDERRLSVRLESISASQIPRFRKLVLSEIGENYDEIDDGFVDGILESHEEGHDPVGFFTEFKEALAVRGARRKLLGFTTVTYKRGGSAKTGPTILLSDQRRRGVGQEVRTALEARVVRRGVRKIYCTAPAISEGVTRYLLKAGYRIEAHLRQQYSSKHDELVFGKLLFVDHPQLFFTAPSGTGRSGRVEIVDRNGDSIRAAQIAELLKAAWFPFADSAAERIATEVCSPVDPAARKPKEALLLTSGGKTVACVILLPKRGGSVKALLISSTNHTPSIERLVEAVCNRLKEGGVRRCYFLHPVADPGTQRLLRSRGFLPEGLLVAPYSPGQDLVVYGADLGGSSSPT